MEIPKLKFDQDLCGICDMNSTLVSVVPLAMFKSDLSLTMIRRVAIIVWVVAVERGIKNENLWGRERT